MPTLSPSRKVRYTAADLKTIEGAKTILHFMHDFDDDGPTDTATGCVILRDAVEHIQTQRNGQPPAEASK